MAQKIKLGVIGMSEGNGHPYSWSAIFNGYNPQFMKDCPFPAIPDYLQKQNFPNDGLSALGAVTHIWTQDREISENIARASNIPNVVVELEELIGKVDAILLARDDGDKHYEMALPFLQAGLPVFIDKPLALSEEMATRILKSQNYDDQVFTCSSIRFAQELQLNQIDRNNIGEIVHVEASVPKKWDTYAIHVIEPIVSQLPNRGPLLKTIPFVKNGIRHILVEWENVSAYIKVTGNVPTPIKLEFFGKKGNLQKKFLDSFSCFKASLQYFIEIIHKQKKNISREETLEIVKIIESGRK